MEWRYGIKEYLEGGVDGSVFEVIEVYEDKDERYWASPCVMGDTMQGLIKVAGTVVQDIKELTQPDVITTLHEWWWADAPDVKYSTGYAEWENEI
jgi:hypothetical protein